MASPAQAVIDALSRALAVPARNVRRAYADTRRLGSALGNALYDYADAAGREVAAPYLAQHADLLDRAGQGPLIAVAPSGKLTGRLPDLAAVVTSGLAGPAPGGTLGAGPVIRSARNGLTTPPAVTNNPLLSTGDEVINNLMPGGFFTRRAAQIAPSYHATVAARTRVENPIRVFHGSPHDFPAEAEVVDAAGRSRFFPLATPLPEEVSQGILNGNLTLREHPLGRFDLDKIGTGEGAQAYGHGLYFAEHEPVALGYRDDLTKPTLLMDGYPIDEWLAMTGHSPYKRLLDPLSSVHESYGFRDFGDVERFLQQELANAETPGMLAEAKRDLNQFYKIAENRLTLEPINGHMYAANLHARPEQFLDWDRPLGQQPVGVREQLRSFDLDYGPFNPSDSGQSIYKTMLARQGITAGNDKGPIALNETLRSAGIPGIRYLDGGSRGLGDGTHNYVVWDPNIIEIARKYALPATLAGGGAYALAGQPAYAQFNPPPGWFDVDKRPKPSPPPRRPPPPDDDFISIDPREYVEPPPARPKPRERDQ